MVSEVFSNYSDITKTDFMYSFVIVSLNQLFAKWHKDKTLLTQNRVVIFLSIQLSTWLKKYGLELVLKQTEVTVFFDPFCAFSFFNTINCFVCFILFNFVRDCFPQSQSRTPRSDKENPLLSYYYSFSHSLIKCVSIVCNFKV